MHGHICGNKQSPTFVMYSASDIHSGLSAAAVAPCVSSGADVPAGVGGGVGAMDCSTVISCW